jgi:opacity protein-like surface antigen
MNGREAFDFRRLLIEGATLLQGSVPGVTGVDAGRPAAVAPAAEKGATRQLHFLGTDYNVTVLVRDWRSAQRLAGGSLTPTDEVRISHSSRMAVARLRAMTGPLRPFIQIGIGQWRVDRDLVAVLSPKSTEMAAQAAVGVELQVAKNAALGVEADYTAFYRDGGADHQNVPAVQLFGLTFAGKMRF